MTATLEKVGPEVAEDYSSVIVPINGNPMGKDLLSMRQFSEDDIYHYIGEAYAAHEIVRDPSRRGLPLLPYWKQIALMRQPSTRTAGSMDTAMVKLGGESEVISGMQSSSEAKGESLADSYIALATQADIIGVRTKEEFGPALAAKAIDEYFRGGKLFEKTPIINLGDGRNEHPTQALGDFFTIKQELGLRRKGLRELGGLTLVLVGDQERYRAFHSDLLGAIALGMNVIAVESEVAQVPQDLVSQAGSSLELTDDLDSAMRRADALIMGRNPDEYDGEDEIEMLRSQQLGRDYEGWQVDLERLQLMPENSVLLHPRPRRNELHPSVDFDKRAVDVRQMAYMIPMRMAIIAQHLGKSIAYAA